LHLIHTLSDIRQSATNKVIFGPPKYGWCKYVLALTLLMSQLLFLPAQAQTYQVGIAPSVPSPVPSYKEVPNPDASRFAAQKGEKLTIRVPTGDPVPEKSDAWRAILAYLSKKSRLDLQLVPIDSQLDFELKLAKGELDFAYLTPLQFVNFNNHPGYHAVVKRKAQPLRGMIVVSAKSPFQTIKDLHDKTLAFPGLLDFPASIATREGLRQLDIQVQPRYLDSASAVYAAILEGKYPGGGGTYASFQALPPQQQDQLRVLWNSPGYTPYAFAAHPGVPFYSIITLQRVMVGMIKDPAGQALLKPVFVDNGFEVASDGDWHDARMIELETLNNPTRSRERSP